jgi:hypothetical protein
LDIEGVFFFSTTAKPNFITRKQRNYKSLKIIKTRAKAVFAIEQPTWSEHKGFKPKDKTELTDHAKRLATSQTSPRSFTTKTAHCDLLHAIPGKAAVQKTDRTLTVRPKRTTKHAASSDNRQPVVTTLHLHLVMEM